MIQSQTILPPVPRAEFGELIRRIYHMGAKLPAVEPNDAVLAERVLHLVEDLLNAKDPSTGEACQRLAGICDSMGRYLQLPYESRTGLGWASYLADIGKLHIPNDVLLHPGRLDGGQWEVMKQHVIYSVRICRDLNFLHDAYPLISLHHERIDGSGYPKGNKDIPYLVQVFSVCDAFEALTAKRAYKEAYPHDVAIAILEDEVERGWRSATPVEALKGWLNEKPEGI